MEIYRNTYPLIKSSRKKEKVRIRFDKYDIFIQLFLSIAVYLEIMIRNRNKKVPDNIRKIIYRHILKRERRKKKLNYSI